jgi:hypothetical protein
MEIMLQPFDEAAYYAYQGVEGAAEIATMNLPLEGKSMECEIVVDDNGINLQYHDVEGDCYHDFAFPMDGQGVTRAKIVLGQLDLTVSTVTVGALQTLGFVYNRV